MKLDSQKGYYGDFGGRFVSELLMPGLIELEKAFLMFVMRLNAIILDVILNQQDFSLENVLAQLLADWLLLVEEYLNAVME